MSMGANAISEMAVAADGKPARYAGRAPANRTVTPMADAVQQPEAR